MGAGRRWLKLTLPNGHFTSVEAGRRVGAVVSQKGPQDQL